MTAPAKRSPRPRLAPVLEDIFPDDRCRFVAGEPNGAETDFCNAPVVRRRGRKSPWCATHAEDLYAGFPAGEGW